MRLSVLALVPAALAAQAPAAPSLADQVKTLTPVVSSLKATDPAAALAKVEAAIPAVPPAFNKKDFASAQDSMGEYNALTSLYRLAASSADSAGQWEKAKDYAQKAKANAQTTYDDASPSFIAFQDGWKKAMEDAKKNLDEMGTLAKADKPTPEQAKRLAVLQQNQGVFQKNVENGQKMVDAVDLRLKDLKDQPSDFDPFIANIDSRLKSEAENIEKFKGDKQKFAAAALKSADDYKDKEQEVTYLRRLLVLDPANKAIAHKLGVLNGTEKDEPAKASKPAKRTRKKAH